MCPGNPGKSWNFILAFSNTGKSWKITASPGKSWKSVNSCNKVFFKNNFLQYYFWISIWFIASIIVHLGVLEKIYLSREKVLERYEPCSILNPRATDLSDSC